jgi:hypothetical protein
MRHRSLQNGAHSGSTARRRQYTHRASPAIGQILLHRVIGDRVIG